MDKSMTEIFSHNLRDCLYMAGMTQADLARKLKVTETSVSKWVLGQTIPRPNKIDEICRILKCSKNDLMVDREKRAIFAPADILADEMKEHPELYGIFNGILKMQSADIKLIADIVERLNK